MYRRQVLKEMFGGEIAEPVDNQEQGATAIPMQPVFINPHTVSPYSGTMEPIPVEKFKDHVQRMHSNDDYLFSEEYNVRCPPQYTHNTCVYIPSMCRMLSPIMPRHPSQVTYPATISRTDMPTSLPVSPTFSDGPG